MSLRQRGVYRYGKQRYLHPHAAAVAVLAEEAIVRGFADGRLAPDVELSRAQAATILTRAIPLAEES